MAAVTLDIVCPKCHSQRTYDLLGQDSLHACGACQTGFRVHLVKVRAKRSRIVPGGIYQRRHFTIRTIEPEGERVVEFTAPLRDVEMRSGDMVGFLYVGQELRLIQNFTINHYTALSAPVGTGTAGGSDGDTIIVRVVLAVLFALVVAFVLASLRR